MNNEELKAAYIQVLEQADAGLFAARAYRTGGDNGLSGLFLPSVSANYSTAKNRVMLVGAETVGWEPLPIGQQFETLENYVERSMIKHRAYFERKLREKQDPGHTFHNYSRRVAQIVGGDGLIYANLFCFDWRDGSPMKSPLFPTIKQLSRQLLDVQIAVLKPQYIIFANGIANAKYRREFFPTGKGGRCSGSKSYPEIAPTHFLWEFMLDEHIRCFRVHHPSAPHPAARKGRSGALSLLAEAVGHSLQPGILATP